MPDILIALALGVGGLLVSQILSFVIMRALMSSRDRERARVETVTTAAGKREIELVAERDHARESDQIRHDNEQKLLSEVSSLKTERSQLAARVAAAEASVDDLARILEDHPGAIPDAVRAAAVRLRQQLSAPSQTTTARDPGGEGDRPVHEGPDALERP